MKKQNEKEREKGKTEKKSMKNRFYERESKPKGGSGGLEGQGVRVQEMQDVQMIRKTNV